MCQQVSYGIQALFGPSDLILGSHVQSLCDALVRKCPRLDFFLKSWLSSPLHLPGHPPPWGSGGHRQQLQRVEFKPPSQSRPHEPGLQGKAGKRWVFGWKSEYTWSFNVLELCEICPDFVSNFNLHIEQYLRMGFHPKQQPIYPMLSFGQNLAGRDAFSKQLFSGHDAFPELDTRCNFVWRRIRAH